MSNNLYNAILCGKRDSKKSFAVLIDPDKTKPEQAEKLMDKCNNCSVDLILVGGSLVVSEHLESLVQQIKKYSNIPVTLFPGSPSQVTPFADALLYLSLISGRNAELLIGQHVLSAPVVRKSGLEIMSTGYMVVDGGAPTTVSYISNANPVPADKNEIAVCTAMAGEMLGMKLIYMDAGSGAKNPVSESMIQSVSKHISIPLIVGGGIRDAERAYLTAKAGADIVVVGNALEKDPTLIDEISKAVHSISQVVVNDL